MPAGPAPTTAIRRGEVMPASVSPADGVEHRRPRRRQRVDHVEVVGAGRARGSRARRTGAASPRLLSTGTASSRSPCTTTTSPPGRVAHPGRRVGGVVHLGDLRRACRRGSRPPRPSPCRARRPSRRSPTGASATTRSTGCGSVGQPQHEVPAGRVADEGGRRGAHRRARRAARAARPARRRGRPTVAARRRARGGTPATRPRTPSATSAFASGRAWVRSYSCRQNPPCT